MLKTELTCYECSYCNKKYSKEEDCLKCENKHLETFNGEKTRFESFKTELANMYAKKNVRPKVIVKETVTVTEEYDTGEVDSDGNPIMGTREVEKLVDKEILGEVPVIHCSKCLRLIHENATFFKSLGYILCLECAIPFLRVFAKNYMNFRNIFSSIDTSSNSDNNSSEDSTSIVDKNEKNCSCCGEIRDLLWRG